MIKKTSLLALVVCLFLILLSPVSVKAQDGLKVLDSSARVEFPSRLDFSLSVESDVNVMDIRLHYTIDRVSYAQVTSEVYIEFVPGTAVDVSWTWDMRRTGGLPPGVGIEYWWTVKDAGGNKIKTTPARVQFDDLRYSWYSLTEGEVTIYWYKGNQSFVQELMAAAQQALARLAEDTGAELERPVRVYVYASSQDLLGSMIYPQEWTGGVAYTRYGTIAIGIAPSELAWGKRAIAHELAHLVIHQMTLNPYNDLPTWLDEGLAMYAEGPLESGYVVLLNKAVAENSLISVRSLSSPFSAYAGEASLAYAQSYSLVEFLIASYGQGKMLELLNTFRQGSSYDGAFNRVYGFDMDGLNTLWRDYIVPPDQVAEGGGLHSALIGTLAGLTTAPLLVLSLAAESQLWR